MRKRWTGKNVNLDRLSDCVERFFTSRNLLPKRTETTEERMISWLPGHTGARMKEPVSVRITGTPNDFTIDMKASELTTRSIRLGILTKPLGGGYLLLKSVKLKEELEKLEREFWIYAEEEIAQFSQSARQAKPSSCSYTSARNSDLSIEIWSSASARFSGLQRPEPSGSNRYCDRLTLVFLVLPCLTPLSKFGIEYIVQSVANQDER